MDAAPGEKVSRAAGASVEVARQTAASAPGLYLHVPFCARVCPYCDFAVQTGGPIKRTAYLQALLDELGGRSAGTPWRDARPFDSVYLGGGTPSSLAPEALARILTAVTEGQRVAEGAEITLEANPEDVDEQRLAAWRTLGITRLSLGVQSFDDAALRFLGRSHTVAQARSAVECALTAGFPAISLDLIFALPQQDAAAWRATLRQAVDLAPHHISCYELTIHPRTRFFRDRERGRWRELVDDTKAERFFETHQILADAGYAGYEVSNFARAARHRSRHNTKYWDHTAYLGVGPSAHSFDGGHTRWWNERFLRDWQRALHETGTAVSGQESLNTGQLVLEALALGLRTTAGVDLAAVERRWGISLHGANASLIGRLIADGLLHEGRSDLLAPTLAGMAIADTLAAMFEIPLPGGTP
ncbi:MAG: radical SAM family heme chaperone HemW [Acidobacteriota bacterium]|jgi:oxygen-independent coproporphyrinogen-3 oxidase